MPLCPQTLFSMNADPSKTRSFTPVKQFSIYSENKVGRLHELISILAANKIHIMAITSVDSTDSSLVRIIVDYFDQAIALLEENNFPFHITEVVCVEISSEELLKNVTCALVEAEINIHYIYPFLMRPHGQTGIVISPEDNELAILALRRHQVNILSQEDITR